MISNTRNAVKKYLRFNEFSSSVRDFPAIIQEGGEKKRGTLSGSSFNVSVSVS
jgi:hypothetical protein